MSKKNRKEIKSLILGFILLLCVYIYDAYLEEPINKLLNRQEETIIQPASVTRKVNVDGNLSVYFVDVGQGDCIMLSNNGKYMLIDAGNNEDGEKLVSYFSSLGIEKFDYVVGTHAHEDHIGGLDDIIKNFDIGSFYMPDVVTTTRTFEEIVEALEEKQVAFETPDIGSSFEFADAKINVIYVGEDSSNLNDTSIVLKMTYGNTSFLFTGDATNKVEREILSKDIDIEADVLKVGHHGSQTSTSKSFLEKVNPSYAVIQVGKNNSYNHPREETLNRLSKLGVKVYRTDEVSTVIATTDGKKIKFTTQETDTNG